MKKKEKAYSVTLASTLVILYLIFVLSTASAATIQNNSPTINETQITTNVSKSEYPDIYKDRIVWQDDLNGEYDTFIYDPNWDIYIYDLSTSMEAQITTNESNQTDPAIYGNRIVWADDRNGNWDIYMYDLSTKKESRITTSGKALRPKIYGNRIVWMDGRNGGSLDENNWADGNWDIYMYDLSTSTEYQITTNESTQQDPDIYEDIIVWWQDNSNTDEYYRCDVYMYDLSTKKESHISKKGYQNYAPSIYGDTIVWSLEDETGLYLIGMYNIFTTTETFLATGYYGESFNPALYEDRIVWMDGRNSWAGDGNYDIYMYDLSTSTETQITTNESWQEYPAIYGDRIVWEDLRNTPEPGSRSNNIYMATISYSPGLPVADFSASPTSGKAPLTVTFTDKSTGSPTKWKWTFGDGASSTDQNPKHQYLQEGKYKVTLTVTNAAGSNTATKTNYIKVVTKPIAAFSAKPTSGKAPLTIAFTDKSTGIPTKWKWSFGDGESSTEKNPKHEYSQEGNYKVTLTVTNVAGSSTLTKTNFIKVTTNTRPGIYSESK